MSHPIRPAGRVRGKCSAGDSRQDDLFTFSHVQHPRRDECYFCSAYARRLSTDFFCTESEAWGGEGSLLTRMRLYLLAASGEVIAIQKIYGRNV
jgi:hypothetical protein